SKRHTNEFCGIGKSTPEPAGSWAPPRRGRWVYEKGGGRAARGRQGRQHRLASAPDRRLRCPLPTLGFLLAREPIFSKRHTNEFGGIGKSTPEPAGSWAPLRPGRWVYERGGGQSGEREQEDSQGCVRLPTAAVPHSAPNSGVFASSRAHF